MSGLPTTVGTADFASLVDLTVRRIQQLVAEQVLPSAGRGQIPLAEGVRAFAKWRSESEIRAFRFDAEARQRRGDSGDDLEAERTRKLRLENDETERLVIRTEEAIAALDSIVGQIPADLAAVAPRVTDDIGMRRRIEDEIDHALNGLARRLAKASADLEAGIDPLGEEAPDDPDEVGGTE